MSLTIIEFNLTALIFNQGVAKADSKKGISKFYLTERLISVYPYRNNKTGIIMRYDIYHIVWISYNILLTTYLLLAPTLKEELKQMS